MERVDKSKFAAFHSARKEQQRRAVEYGEGKTIQEQEEQGECMRRRAAAVHNEQAALRDH